MRRYNSTETVLVEKLRQLPSGILTVTFALLLVGVIVLFSAAKGNLKPLGISPDSKCHNRNAYSYHHYTD
jgi:hypothetical protein